MRAVPRTLRLMNQRAVLERLFREGPTTRAALAEATGMSRPTSGLIIEELLGARVLEEGALATDGKPGRPGRSVMLERKTPRFLLVQIGVKHTDLAAVPVGRISAISGTRASRLRRRRRVSLRACRVGASYRFALAHALGFRGQPSRVARRSKGQGASQSQLALDRICESRNGNPRDARPPRVFVQSTARWRSVTSLPPTIATFFSSIPRTVSERRW